MTDPIHIQFEHADHSADVWAFDSIEALARYAKENPCTYSPSWCGGLTWEQTIDRAFTGDDVLVERSRKMVEDIDTHLDIPHREWQPSPMGAYPIVADFLAGRPDSMRHLTPSEGTAPIRIFASLCVSAGISAEDMLKRGCAIFGLVLKLQESGRAVDLEIVCPWRGYNNKGNQILTATINTRPLDLAHACFAIAHPAYFRYLGHAALYRLDPSNSTSILGAEATRTALSLNPQDLYLDSMVIDEAMIKDPREWVKNQLSQFNGR